MTVKVSVVNINSSRGETLQERVVDAVRNAMELAGWTNYISNGVDVALKLNLTLDILLPGSNTSPWVVKGVIEAIYDHVRNIYLVDSNQLLFSADKAFRTSFVKHLADKYEKVFWYNFRDVVVDSDSFMAYVGLVRNDLSPKHAIETFSELIREH